MKQFSQGLEACHYSKKWQDDWQFWPGEEMPAYIHDVCKVQTSSELEAYVDVFDECYQKDDPQNPYGELGAYKDDARRAWLAHRSTEPGRLNYYMVYKAGEPVAVSALTNYHGIGYISNVGSLSSVRGEGFGKAATLHAVKQSILRGNSAHCLATEKNKYPNEFYRRIGFVSRFLAVGYSQNVAAKQ